MMHRITFFAVLLTGGNLFAADLPTHFATAGTTVSIRLAGVPQGGIVLRALGRTWTDPILTQKGVVEVVAPPVRVPLRFEMVSDSQPLATLVVYPKDFRLAWDPKVPLLYDPDAPAWVSQWFAVTGLPAKAITSPSDQPGGLVVAGPKLAGATVSEFLERRREWGRSVLVLDAIWFGEAASHGAVQMTGVPRQFGHALVELNRHQWPQAVVFRNVRGPWGGIANRQVWIDGPVSPLVERVPAPGRGQVVFSYLPWEQQMGIETADALFVAVLKHAATWPTGVGPSARTADNDPEFDRDVRIVWPAAETINSRSRPVLAAVLHHKSKASTAKRDPRPFVSILDLRGPALSTNDAEGLPEVLITQDWIVLGSDRQVRIPPRRTTSDDQKPEDQKRDHVVRLDADELPASRLSQVRLMQALSDQGVFIGKLTITGREP